jgi:hypothetical protein
MAVATRLVGGAAVVAGVAAGAARWVMSQRDQLTPQQGNGHQTQDRWHMVTINRPQEEVAPGGQIPEPLSKLGDQCDFRVRPAPAGRGTELGARLRTAVPAGPQGLAARISGDDPRQEVRAALRATRCLIETGEVLRPDQPPTTKRTPTRLPLELMRRRAWGEGRL